MIVGSLCDGLIIRHALRDVLKLKVTEAQNQFVAPNTVSIAQAHFYPEKAWFRAIYADETAVGFLMISILIIALI